MNSFSGHLAKKPAFFAAFFIFIIKDCRRKSKYCRSVKNDAHECFSFVRIVSFRLFPAGVIAAGMSRVMLMLMMAAFHIRIKRQTAGEQRRDRRIRAA